MFTDPFQTDRIGITAETWPDSIEGEGTPNGAPGPAANEPGRIAAAGPGLSKAHNSPGQLPQWMARVWDGGGLVELIGPGIKAARPGGAKRGRIGCLSPASRSRLLRKMSRLRRDEMPVFATVTYPDEFTPEPARWKRDLDALLKRLRRLFPAASGFWKLELKARQSGQNAGQLAPHFHLLLWGIPWDWEDRKGWEWHLRFELQCRHNIVNGRRLVRREVFENGAWMLTESCQSVEDGTLKTHSRRQRFKRRGQLVERETVEWWLHDGVPHLDQEMRELGVRRRGCRQVELREWFSLAWYEIVGSEELPHLRAGTNIEQVRSNRGVMFYAAKYVAKAEENASPVGRWWGTVNANALPWAKAVDVELGPRPAARLRRTARRYVNRVRKKGRRWRPRGSCTWFCEGSAWLRWVRELWEPPDPFQVEAIAGRPDALYKPTRR